MITTPEPREVSSIDPRRAPLAEKLAQLANEGKLGAFFSARVASADERHKMMLAYMSWDGRVKDLISSALGDTELHWYIYGRENAERPSQELETVGRFYDSRTNRIRNLMDRIDSVDVRGHWQP